jgi:hypothetical protein
VRITRGLLKSSANREWRELVTMPPLSAGLSILSRDVEEIEMERIDPNEEDSGEIETPQTAPIHPHSGSLVNQYLNALSTPR